MPFFFIHIPKTAGTSIRATFNAHFSEERVLGLYPSAPFEPLDRRNVDAMAPDAYDLFIGHERLGEIEKYALFDQCVFMTMLRNPMDRVISYYNHAMVLFPRYAENKIALDEFLEEDNYELDNLQVRYLSSCPKERKVEESDLHEAISNVEQKISYCGIQELFGESSRIFAELIGASPSSFSIRANVSQGGISRSDISADTVERIKSRSRFDYVLYDRALTLHRQRISAGTQGG